MIKNKLFFIIKLEIKENIKNKWLLLYGIIFTIFIFLLSKIGVSNIYRTNMMSINLILLLLPLTSLIFSFISISESINFQEYLISLPVKRSVIFIGKLIGISSSLSFSFVVGVFLGSVIQNNNYMYNFNNYMVLLTTGLELIFIFNALSFLVVTVFKKKEIALLIIILLWFILFIVYDIMIINLIIIFNQYPIEKLILLITAINPIDLARLTMLFKMDVSAIMSCSFMVYEKFLRDQGSFVCSVLLFIWIILISRLGVLFFEKKDF